MRCFTWKLELASNILQIIVATKLQFKLTILMFWTKIAQKAISELRQRNRTFACVSGCYLLYHRITYYTTYYIIAIMSKIPKIAKFLPAKITNLKVQHLNEWNIRMFYHHKIWMFKNGWWTESSIETFDCLF